MHLAVFRTGLRSGLGNVPLDRDESPHNLPRQWADPLAIERLDDLAGERPGQFAGECAHQLIWQWPDELRGPRLDDLVGQRTRCAPGRIS